MTIKKQFFQPSSLANDSETTLNLNEKHSIEIGLLQYGQ